jgi:hypothetical protein
MGVAAAAPVAPDIKDPAILAEGLVASVAVDHCLVPAADPADFTVGESYFVHGFIVSRAV